MGFSINYSELNDLLPEGTYEALITTASEEIDRQMRARLNFMLTIRNDVQQKCQNRTMFRSMYKSKEPKPVDEQTDNYNYDMLMRIGGAAKLPENKTYNSIAEFLNDLVNRPVKIDVHHKDFNGNKSAEIKKWYASDKPEIQHQFKQKPAQTPAPAQTAASAPLPWGN